MLGRLATLLLVTLFAMGAAVPSLGAVRCNATGLVMAQVCCDRDALPAEDGEAHFARRCCEKVESASATPAELHGRGIPSLQPELSLIGLVESPATMALGHAWALWRPGDPRGSPPGERLHRFTAILRV